MCHIPTPTVELCVITSYLNLRPPFLKLLHTFNFHCTVLRNWKPLKYWYETGLRQVQLLPIKYYLISTKYFSISHDRNLSSAVQASLLQFLKVVHGTVVCIQQVSGWHDSWRRVTEEWWQNKRIVLTWFCNLNKKKSNWVWIYFCPSLLRSFCLHVLS